jgi:uncharacterized protein
MTGERNLSRLQRHMAPQMHSETFVYCNFPDFEIPPGMSPICTFREAEGLTVIVEKGQAEHRAVEYVFEARLITLTVHSSLEAVGFLAALAGSLAQASIPCNAVAGYHHDHLFVPTARAGEAFALLSAMASP